MAIININGIIGQDYTYKQFITDYANAGAEQIRLMINSPGGEVNEGEAIAEFIRQHATRFDSVINGGDVASIAASIFLALPYEKRFFDARKGVALIHNPMFQPNLDEAFTADELINLSDTMRSTQEGIKKYIAKQTGADADVVAALMAINEPLSESQLESINFANIVKFQAVATFKKNDDMKLTEIKEGIDKILAKMNGKIVALMLTDANGATIEFPEVPDGSMPVVGDKTTAPDGEVVMADGFTYVIVGGAITEIKEPEMPIEGEDVAALKAENESLKAQLAGFNEIKAQVIALQGKIKSQMIDDEPIVKDVEKPASRLSDIGNKLK